MKYKKKVVSVEAVLFDPYGLHRNALPTGVSAEISVEANLGLRAPGREMDFFVVTMDGKKVQVMDGDWIVTEPDGVHHSPCKPYIFEATYEVE